MGIMRLRLRLVGLGLRSSRRCLRGNRPWRLPLHGCLLGCTLNSISPDRLAGSWSLVLLRAAREGRKFAKRRKIECQSTVLAKVYKVSVDPIRDLVMRIPKLAHDGYTPRNVRIEELKKTGSLKDFLRLCDGIRRECCATHERSKGVAD